MLALQTTALLLAVLVQTLSSAWLARRSAGRNLLALQAAVGGLSAVFLLSTGLGQSGLLGEQTVTLDALRVFTSTMAACYLLAALWSWARDDAVEIPMPLLAAVSPLVASVFSAAGVALTQLQLFDDPQTSRHLLDLLRGVPMLLTILWLTPGRVRRLDPDGLFRELPWLLVTGLIVANSLIWPLVSNPWVRVLSLLLHAGLAWAWAWSANRAQELRLHPDNAGAASLRALQESLLLLSERGVVDYANPRAVELLGMNPEGVMLTSFVEGGQLLPGRVRLRTAGGDWVDVVLSLAPILLGGRRVGMAVSATDVRELQAALASAQRAAHSRQEFLAVMSHEIRTPMNAVLGLAHLLEGTDLDMKQRRWVHTICQSADALLVMLSDILDLSRIEAGRVEIEAVAWSPAEVMESAAILVENLAQEKGLTLEYSLTGLPAFLCGDPTRVRQVVLNLLSNAVKFTERGSVRLHAEWADGALLVQVSDTGIGIPRDKISGLFDAFVQVDASTTRRYGGSGLGLAISQSFAKMMGGSLSAESTLEQGSCFSLRIPAPLADSAPVIDTSVQCHVDLCHLKVLVVEDNAVNRMVLRAVLARIGVVPEEAENGAVGLREMLEHRYDVVVMDLQMPVMDGWEAIRRIRACLGQRSPWLIAHSANVSSEEIARALACGADDHLCKPATPADVEAAIRRGALKGRSLLRGSSAG